MYKGEKDVMLVKSVQYMLEWRLVVDDGEDGCLNGKKCKGRGGMWVSVGLEREKKSMRE